VVELRGRRRRQEGLNKHAESVGELVALGGLADTSDATAAALGACGLGLFIVGAVVVLAGIIVIAASPAGIRQRSHLVDRGRSTSRAHRVHAAHRRSADPAADKGELAA
jgi:hypothetical protein